MFVPFLVSVISDRNFKEKGLLLPFLVSVIPDRNFKEKGFLSAHSPLWQGRHGGLLGSGRGMLLAPP